MASALERVSQTRCFGGQQEFYKHASSTCRTEMRFSVYLPPQAASESVPVLYYLSGLTCTEENFMSKAGAQRLAAQHGLMLVAPDTSPRNNATPGEADSWDLGSGAGFYVDATQSPWSNHYSLYSYVTCELPHLIRQHFAVRPERQGIFGHSMGGHGALISALKQPSQYVSVSAFAPIAAPMRCPWGQKAFSHYLGADPQSWKAYDASELVLSQQLDHLILIDQGSADPFLEPQLKPELFQQACAQVNQSLELRIQPDYDHSYYFIASFMADHMRHHAERLWRS
ncbi:MAG: S-formylglutathione hydrolase [Pegethrix bostrychoides GSE-TBD4-15B]|jgi:S-formylglutathione hydrolase|uniref:S-formylglutathione hydrolase n=1 Tax=Pegethrix bostrychoides GSE-TBD4-15B TaxID=2839662 RepID=A0A951PCW9_9CYAN|nr:S-formylglutathione hydrolase [Pegethrix bostrychoides GSE-TBD4-15B]